MSLLKRRSFLFEADDDQSGDATTNTGGDNSEQSTDGNTDTTNDSGEEDNNNASDTETDDNTNDDENSDDDNGEDKDNADDEDYSIDAEADEEDSNDDNGDDEESSDDSSDDSSSDDSADNEEKALDRDLFSTLSEDEQKRKIATLKRLFIDLYSKADVLIEKFNQVESEDNDENFYPIIKRILGILYDMKEYISYYILNVFDKVSYIENDITLNRYLSILNGIKVAIEDLEKEKNKEDKTGKK